MFLLLLLPLMMMVCGLDYRPNGFYFQSHLRSAFNLSGTGRLLEIVNGFSSFITTDDRLSFPHMRSLFHDTQHYS